MIVMYVINPLTKSSDIARAVSKISPLPMSKDSPIKATFGSFAADVVSISTLGLEKQQKEIQTDTSNKIEYIANEVISVSSSIGSAKAVRNLTHSQATKLYDKISHLL